VKQLPILLLALLLLFSSCADGQAQGSAPLSTENPSVTVPESTTAFDSSNTDTETTEETLEWDTEVETEPETEPDNGFDTDYDIDFGTESDETEEEWVEPPYYEVDGYVYRIDVSKYLSYIAPKNDEEYLILANRNHYLSSSYKPTDLVRTKANYDKKMRKAACYALDAMFEEMKALGVCDTIPQSAYRSYATQVEVYNSYLKKERKKHPTYTDEQIEALVQQYSSPPGASDHQTGLAVDFSPIASSFRYTKAFQYLSKNAYKFGFILRFPNGKTDITGYKYESWHWRFVGREAATEIYERGITLEEYLEELYGGIIPPETSAPESSAPESSDTETDDPGTSLPDNTDFVPLPDDSSEEELPTDTDSDTEPTEPPDTDRDIAAPPSHTETDSAPPAESDAGQEPLETAPDGSKETVIPSDTESTRIDVADTTEENL